MPVNKSSGGPSDHRRIPPSKEPDSDEPPSNTLWVGHLSADTTDSDVMSVFAKRGGLDCTTMHGSRSYTFVYFRQVDEAKAAKEALQGCVIRGSAIRIEFARPPKAAKHIWVGGFNLSITKEQLEDEFSKFGKMEDYKFFRDRNSAIIEYSKLEDAIAAHKSMNGKRLAGEQIRVDFLRSQPPSRRDWPDRNDSRNGYLGARTLGPLDRSLPTDDLRNFHSSPLGFNRDVPHLVRKDGPPSNVLWIGYPPPVQIDEQMLHNAMILFGEIERIRSFPSKHCSFVEFRSIDEARRAKEGLQGRLFNDPRIQILYSDSDLTLGKDNLPHFPGFRPHRPEMYLDEGPFGALEMLATSRLIPPNSFPGSLHANVIPGSNIVTRPFGPQGFDHRHVGPEFHELGGLPPNILDVDASKSMPSSWRRGSPSAPGILPSPGMFQALRSKPDGWDGLDMRDPKRVRVTSPADESFRHARRDGSVSIEDHPFVLSHPDKGAASRSQLGPVLHNRPDMHASDKDYSWRGVIAKGGAHVCYARCISIGKGIDSPMPAVVNCSARTGLDMLTKHYAEAIGFEVVFFLPDSEEDFASYTDFLRYLGLKNRAGVAKLEDGTTLFLVPPSDFLTKVLSVNGPERLYGVVLKMPQQAIGAVVRQPQLPIPPLSHDIDRQEAPNMQKSYNFNSHTEDQARRLDYNNQSLPENVTRRAVQEKFQSAHGDHTTQSVALDQDSNATASQLKVSLTPDLIATLASLIPSNTSHIPSTSQSSGSGALQLPSSSNVGPTSYTPVMPDGSMPSQSWRHDNQTLSVASMGQQQNLPSHLGQDFSSQASSHSQFLPYTSTSSGIDPAMQPFFGGMQVQNPALNMPQAPAGSTSLLNSYAITQNNTPFSATSSNQLYQFDNTSANRENYGNLQTTNAADAYGSVVHQQPTIGSSYAHDSVGTIPQQQHSMPVSDDKGHVEYPIQGQQLQNVLPGSSQGASQSDADKNQRYQSTLQFAASLLLQIQQQQQQANAQSAQGPGNHQ